MLKTYSHVVSEEKLDIFEYKERNIRESLFHLFTL